ncbi:MAG: putative oxidoreductase YvaA [Mucilaginibacter sp.]|nr:putative oxidoreductase YvaA [Mucilaginibacter sp.]
MSKPIVTGIMSYGMSGRIFHAPFLSTNPGFKLKAVVERHEKKMAAVYPAIVSYDTVDQLLNDREIELIIVNTPNFTHFDFAKKALLAGKHVLIEKPAAGNTKEIKELYDLAKTVNLQVMVYQNRRWDSDFLAVKEVIESGKLGRLTEVHFRYDRYKPVLAVKAFKETGDTPINGLVFDLAPHIIDQAMLLFGQPLSFDKLTASQREGSEVVDYFNFRLKYPNQLVVYLTGGLLIPEPLPSFVVHGTLGSFIKNRCDVQEVQLDKGMSPVDEAYGMEPKGSEGKLVTMEPDDHKTITYIPSSKGNYKYLFDAVYHTIRDNALYPITEEHISWQMELLEA